MQNHLSHWTRPVRAFALSSLVAAGPAAAAGSAHDGELSPTNLYPPEPTSLSMVADKTEIMFQIRGGFEHQLETNIDLGGEFSSSRIGASINAMSDITPDFDVRFVVGYEFDHYNFSGNTAASLGVNDPWKDIHTLGFGVIFGADLTDDWRLFGGPVFQFAAESGAKWRDGFVGGGVIGTSVRIDEHLTLGGGIGVVSQIEDSARFFPVVFIEWNITDQLKLTSRTMTNATGDSGVELVYDWGGGIETAIGGAYRFRRFRLDDSGPVPDGVGEHGSFPLWIRATFHLSQNFTMNVYGGAVFAGELRLENENGFALGNQDYDATGVFGISASVRF